MPLFRKKTAVGSAAYDRKKKTPAIRASICTGEKVAGFRDKETGSFEEIMLIRSEKDLALFREQFRIEEEIPVFY